VRRELQQAYDTPIMVVVILNAGYFRDWLGGYIVSRNLFVVVRRWLYQWL
jgi:hypothetical protein